MDQVDTSIADQNTLVGEIGGKLTNLKERIAASKKNGDETMSSIPPIVKEINKKLDIIKKLVANAKTIQMQYDATNTRVQKLGNEKEVVSKELAEKNRQIATLNEQLKNNESTAVDNHTKLTAQIDALNQANLESVAAKETVEANLTALQRQSATATQQQQGALQAAQQAQRTAEQAVVATKAELEKTRRHADDMQGHMNKLGKLKKHQEDLTKLLQKLDEEISAANIEMNDLDDAHVDHLRVIKEHLTNVDGELRKIIEGNPGTGDGGVGSSTTDVPFRQGQGNFNSPPAAGGDPAREQSVKSRSQAWNDRISQSQADEMLEVYPGQPGEESADAIYGTPSDARDSDDETSSGAKKGIQPQNMTSIIGRYNSRNPLSKFSRNVNMRNQPPSAAQEQFNALREPTQQEKDYKQLFGRDRPTNLYNMRRGGTRKKQHGGYIAVKKTRSKSSSSSGRRGSSSSSKSTRRRHRRRGSSSSSTRSSRR